ncbi:MAG: AEC family transporter [Desulfobacterales bacterium]|nr:AEC family transporter [Desulfobacterales bacterium]
MFAQLFGVISPILICAGAGLIWVRLDYRFPTDFVSRIIMYFGAPCMVLSSLTRMQSDMDAVLITMGLGMLTMSVTGLLGWLLLRRSRLDLHSFLPSLLFPNCGNMGLSLCLFAFGQEGLTLGVGYFTAMLFFQFTLGNFIYSHGQGSWADRLKSLARQPVIYAMFLGLICMQNQWSLPLWAANTTHLMGGVTIPLMLLTLGASLGQLRVGAWKMSLGFSFIRIFGGLAVAFGLCSLFGVEGLPRKVILLQSAMPVAVFNYLLALHYNRKHEDVAGIVVVSTLVGFAFLPFLMGWLMAA